MASDSCQVKCTEDTFPHARLCQICSKNGISRPATIFCSTCEEFQCEDCANGHTIYKFLKNHNLQNATEAKPSLTRISICEKHNESIDFYCKEHNELCCGTCAFLGHKQCLYIDEISRTSEQTDNDCTFLKDKFCELQNVADRIGNHLVKSETHLKKQAQNVLKEINGVQEKMNKSFQDLSCELQKEALFFKEQKADDLNKVQNNYIQLRNKLEHEKDLLSSVLKDGRPTQQFLAQFQLNDSLTSMKEELKHVTSKLDRMDFKIEFEKCIYSFSDDFRGNLTTSVTKHYHSTENKKLNFKVNTTVNISKLYAEDKHLLYTNMEFLKDGRLLAIECHHKDMLIFDEKLKCVNSHRFHSTPFCLVLLSQTEIAVSQAGRIEFYFISRDNTVILLRILNTSYNCRWLRVLDEDNFAASYLNETCLKKISHIGKESDIVCETPLKQFSDSDFQFTFIANTEKVVTCNQDDNSVCIYDIVKNTVVTVKDKTILSPSCMAVGPLDSILVCSSVGNTIVHISPAGTIVGAYDLGLVSPLTCCISSDMKKIAVTSGKNGEQVLNVLDISY
ncbi:uncharacterized protein LOC132729253 [Ruditapes philippinarum]|uniref:uncharacterized protein LOC132729253 n=1 Tax=Ruditapes philippinarum TaxID=129788 RepID=UPI00295BCB24|nr:uncharacterized protein LOC132729253 [Ruditapes philippinarum]